jgi:hypothetical protein
MKDKILNNISHKIYMQLMLMLRRGMDPQERMDDADIAYITKIAPKMAATIIDQYKEKKGAGPLWLDRMLQNNEWMLELEAKAKSK